MESPANFAPLTGGQSETVCNCGGEGAEADDCSGPSYWMIAALRRSFLGDQCLFEVLAERGLQRVKLAHRGIG